MTKIFWLERNVSCLAAVASLTGWTQEESLRHRGETQTLSAAFLFVSGYLCFSQHSDKSHSRTVNPFCIQGQLKPVFPSIMVHLARETQENAKCIA